MKAIYFDNGTGMMFPITRMREPTYYLYEPLYVEGLGMTFGEPTIVTKDEASEIIKEGCVFLVDISSKTT